MAEGTCIWWKDSYGFIGRGIFTNSAYESQIYCHWKNIERKGLRDPKYRELAPGDVVEFTEGTGFFIENGSQALKVKVIQLAEINNERQAIPRSNGPDAEVDQQGLAQHDGPVSGEIS